MIKQLIIIGLLWVTFPGVMKAQNKAEEYLAKDNVADFNYFETGENRRIERKINEIIEEEFDAVMRARQLESALTYNDLEFLEEIHNSCLLNISTGGRAWDRISTEISKIGKNGFTEISQKMRFQLYNLLFYLEQVPELKIKYQNEKKEFAKQMSNLTSDILSFDDYNHLTNDYSYSPSHWDINSDIPFFIKFPAIGFTNYGTDRYYSNNKKYYIKSFYYADIHSNETDNELFSLKDDVKARLVCYCAFAPDDATVACGDIDGYLYLWDVYTGKLLYRNKKHKELVQHIAFSKDGKWLATASYDNNIIVWEAASGKATYILKGHTDGVMNLAFHPNGTMLASASKDRTIRVWDFKNEEQLQINRDYSDEAYVVTYSRDGQYLYSGSKSGSVLEHETTNINNTKEVLSGTEPVYMVAFDASGNDFNVVTKSTWYKFDYGEKTVDAPLSHQQNNTNISTKKLTVGQSDVDVNIPVSSTKHGKTYALIIGNENYDNEIQVDYAATDAATFKKYAELTLGIPTGNIRHYQDASYGQLLAGVEWLRDMAKAHDGEARLIFYYAGHGMPDEGTKDGYLLPVDGSSSRTSVALSLNKVYAQLAKYPAKSTNVFLDACFSGSARDGMLASGRGVAIKPKDATVSGNMVVFSAVTGEQTAHPYTDKQHGLFTYYLLKKLQATKGEVTLQELGNYICNEVSRQSILVNRKEQNPQVLASPSLGDGWKTRKLK